MLFRSASQIDFTFTRQQRNGAHFAQVHANRVVGIDGLFNRMGGRELLAILRFFRVKKAAFLIERESERFCCFA